MATRVTVTIPVERDLELGSVALESVTATADVDLSNDDDPVRWISVEQDGVPIMGDELIDLTAPLSALEDAVLAEAMRRRGPLVASAAATCAERSVA